MTSEPLNQYTEIYRDSIKSSSAKLSKTFENLLLEILLLYMTIQRKINFTQMERYGVPISLDVPRHLTENQLQETWPHMYGRVAYWRTWMHSLHTHSLFKGIEVESASCHLDYAERKAQAFLLNKDIHVGWGCVAHISLKIPNRVLFSRCKAVYWPYALPGKTREPVGLFLQCIIRITECCESDDEGKWTAVFHGFFQGNHGEHIHR